MAQLTKLVVGVPIPSDLVDRIQTTYPGVRVNIATGVTFLPELRTAEAGSNWELSAEELATLPDLRWFQCIAAGVDHFPLSEMSERGILLSNNSGVHASNIAEHILAMMLAFARRIPFLLKMQQKHVWAEDARRTGVFELAGQRLLVVGLGDIGLALARKANALGMAVDGVRRSVGTSIPGIEHIGTVRELPMLLPSADHVAICLPLTSETNGLFGSDAFARMKRGAFIYNIGRGPMIVTAALTDALSSGHLGGAGLDVTDPEPLDPNSPLWDMTNVIITGHTAGATPKYWERAGEILYTNVGRFIRDEPLLNQVNFERGY
jgi:phosphoglycerate dehydrogenase-like enzyme